MTEKSGPYDPNDFFSSWLTDSDSPESPGDSDEETDFVSVPWRKYKKTSQKSMKKGTDFSSIKCNSKELTAFQAKYGTLEKISWVFPLLKTYFQTGKNPPFCDNWLNVSHRMSQIFMRPVRKSADDKPDYVFDKAREEAAFELDPTKFEHYFSLVFENRVVDRYTPFFIRIDGSLSAFDTALLSKEDSPPREMGDLYFSLLCGFYLVSETHLSHSFSIVGCALRSLKKATEKNPILEGLDQQYFALFSNKKNSFIIGKLPV